jgi:Heavy metal associated domain 2
MTTAKSCKFNKNTINNLKQQRKRETLPQADNVRPQEISYSIAHAIPGRVRFRIPLVATDSWYADKLKAVMEADTTITDVRINTQAASVVINYKRAKISEDEMRSHLVRLIQTAPNIDVPKEPTAKSVVESIFNAIINLIDSIRNVNNVRSAIKHKKPQNSTWERVLTTARNMVKGLKSAIVIFLPKRKALGLQQRAISGV